ncbi:MAG: GTPase ObgE [Nitrospinota bacterium]
MNFIDEVELSVCAGRGGDGCVSFRREKFIPNGGPDGGNGGAGGNVIFVGDHNINTLLDVRNQKIYKAGSGGNGKGNTKTGKSGEDIFIPVPVGTLVKDKETLDILDDIDEDHKEFAVARGGRGGKGNAVFKSSTNRAPRYATEGKPGESRELKLELKLIADVGIVGYPNAGKSTLISKISSAKPKIADYPFTTLIPSLGVVRVENFSSFVAADIPGLIKDAHTGKGLGGRFLRHIERTSVLLHLLDLSTSSGDPVKEFDEISNELALFNPMLSKKKRVVAGNKADMENSRHIFGPVRKEFARRGIEYFEVSSLTGQGLKPLIYALWEIIKKNRG